MQIINFHLGARVIGTSEHSIVSLEAPSFYEWAPAKPAQFNNLTYVECPHRVVLRRQTNPHKAIRGGALPYAVIYYVLTAGRLDNRGERYNRDLLMPSAYWLTARPLWRLRSWLLRTFLWVKTSVLLTTGSCMLSVPGWARAS